MDKFRKAIEQLNKPIRESKKTVKIAPQRAAKSKTAEKTIAEPIKEKAAEPVAETEREIVTEPVIEAEPVAEADTEPLAEQNIEVTEIISPKEENSEDSEKEMSEREKELEAEFLALHPETKALLKHKKREAKKKNKEERKKNRSVRKKDKTVKKEKNKEVNEGSILAKYGIRTIIVVAVCILAVIGILANMRLNNQLKPVFYQVQSNRVVENVRIVAISDMHLKEFGENNTRLVEKIKSYHPDIIAILGDMNIDDNPDYSAVINLCARLNNVAPLYYALGNHEFEAMLFRDSQIYYDMKAAGIKVLNNEVETVEIGLSTIDVIGVTQGPKRFREDAQKFFEEAMNATDNFKLVLTHYPENFDGVMEEYPIDLALCGHAHGGQVRLPIIGGLYSSDQGILPKLCDGYHEIENSKVIISKGLGRSGVVPRINNAPEITIVDINWY